LNKFKNTLKEAKIFFGKENEDIFNLILEKSIIGNNKNSLLKT
jgi:hypothetical protein